MEIIENPKTMSPELGRLILQERKWAVQLKRETLAFTALLFVILSLFFRKVKGTLWSAEINCQHTVNAAPWNPPRPQLILHEQERFYGADCFSVKQIEIDAWRSTNSMKIQFESRKVEWVTAGGFIIHHLKTTFKWEKNEQRRTIWSRNINRLEKVKNEKIYLVRPINIRWNECGDRGRKQSCYCEQSFF